MRKLIENFGARFIAMDNLNEKIFRRALKHDDLRVQDGLEHFMNVLLGSSLPCNQFENNDCVHTYAVVCEVNKENYDMPLSMSSTHELKRWAEKHFNKPKNMVYVCPDLHSPNNYFQGVNFQFLELFHARNSRVEEIDNRQIGKYRGQHSKDYKFLTMFYVSVAYEDQASYMNEITISAEPNNKDSFAMTYDVSGTSHTASVVPIDIGEIFSTAKLYAFSDDVDNN
jgi:hypothetical protein